MKFFKRIVGLLAHFFGEPDGTIKIREPSIKPISIPVRIDGHKVDKNILEITVSPETGDHLHGDIIYKLEGIIRKLNTKLVQDVQMDSAYVLGKTDLDGQKISCSYTGLMRIRITSFEDWRKGDVDCIIEMITKAIEDHLPKYEVTIFAETI